MRSKTRISNSIQRGVKKSSNMALKTVIFIALLLVSTFGATHTIASDSGNSVTIGLSNNSGDNSKWDMTIKWTFPSTIMDDSFKYSEFAWIDVGVASYALTENTPNLTSFANWIRCGSTCSSINDIDRSEKWHKSTSDYVQASTSFNWAAGSNITSITPTNASSTTDHSWTVTWAGLDETQQTEYGIPKAGDTAYFRCFALFNDDKQDYTAAITDIGSTLTVMSNITVEGCEKDLALVGNISLALTIGIFLSIFSIV